MTVQEAKNQIEYNVKYRIFTPRVEALQIALECIEEVEQYRALGTVEELEKKIKTELPYMSLAQARFKSELDEYRNIGTVEELKEAREKQVAKKPIMKTVVFCEEAEDAYVCSVCEGESLLFEGQPYCENCGSKVDWGEEDE